jgi:hypothetical protein
MDSLLTTMARDHRFLRRFDLRWWRLCLTTAFGVGSPSVIVTCLEVPGA